MSGTVRALPGMTEIVSTVPVTRMTDVMSTVTTMRAVAVLTNSTERHGDESNAAHGKRGQVYVHA